MVITVTGPRGGGSTTITAMIYRFLSDRGQDVQVLAGSAGEQRAIEQGVGSEDMPLRARITIVSGIEREDECSVGRRELSNP